MWDVFSTRARGARSRRAARIVARRSPRLAPKPMTARSAGAVGAGTARLRGRRLEHQRFAEEPHVFAVDLAVLTEEEEGRLLRPVELGVERDARRLVAITLDAKLD